MRKTFQCIVTILFLLTTSTAYADTIVSYGGTLQYEPGYQQFLVEHPGTTIEWPSQVFSTRAEFTNALLTGTYTCDMFIWRTNQVDWQLLMEKGYCYDLSQSAVLMEAVQKMHPRIAEQAMRDGKLFAIPYAVGFSYLQVAENTWLEAGYTLEDVPKSFPAFLDFLDKWCDRIEAGDASGIRVIGGWDAGSYTNASYVEWLTKLLVDEAILQMQYAGESLHFDDPQLRVLLDRCCEIGQRLYALEPRADCAALLELSARNVWPKDSNRIVFLRLDETQPLLINASLDMWAVFSDASNPEICIDLLEYIVTDTDETDNASDLLLFANAEPRVNPEYVSGVATWKGKLNEVDSQLQASNLSTANRMELEELRAKYLLLLERQEEIKWVMDADQLADYQAHADGLFFAAPSVFTDVTEGYDMLASLYKRFASQSITENAFLTELDRIAQMLTEEQ